MERIVGVAWPEAAIAMVVIGLVGALVLLVVWQLLKMGRDRAQLDHNRNKGRS